MEIDDFAIQQLLNVIETSDGSKIYWRETVDEGQGYICLWEDGTSHHTYHHPESLKE